MLQARKEDWTEKLQALRDLIAYEIVSYQRLIGYLGEILESGGCPIQKIDVKCQYANRTIIEFCVGSANGSEDPFRLDDATSGYAPVRVFISYWTKTEGPVSVERIRPIIGVVMSYLSTSDRRKGMLILDLKRHQVAERVCARIESLTADRKSYAVVYIDLDNFKSVNDSIGHDEGDRALRDIESDINDLSRELPVTGFSDGGDEFELLFETADEFSILRALSGLRRKVRARQYGAGRVQIDLTAGVAMNNAVTATSFQELRKIAEDATKKVGNEAGTKGEKKRGTVTFVTPTGNEVSFSEAGFEQLGIAIIRSGVLNRRPFANQVLNFLSDEIHSHLASICKESDLEIIYFEEILSHYVSWLGLTAADDFREHHLLGQLNFDPVLPPKSVSLAVAHGVLRASAGNSVLSSYFGEAALSIGISGKSLSFAAIRCGERSIGIARSHDINCQWLEFGKHIAGNKGVPCDFVPVSIALVIGLSEMLKSPGGNPIPTGLLGGVAVVDDRPKLGGGLPDFWQAALASITSSWSLHRQSISSIVVMGDYSTAPETYLRLESKKPVDEYELAILANRTVVEVNRFLDWAKSNIERARCFEQLVAVLHRSALNLTEISPNPPSNRSIPQPTLTRSASAEGLTLPIEEGLCCKNAKQAYPAILDLLRHSSHAAETLDDASQMMFELLGFKLLILDPSKDPVPDYLFETRESMQKYAEDVLLEEGSLIGKHFHVDGQFKRFVSHLSDYFEKDDGRTSTRRAVLVVPNPPADDPTGSPRPLGLMGIWATPRNTNGKPELQFCFVWRTVEALVGLPFSLFASIRFANMIVDKINEQKHGQHRSAPARVSLGPLRYLALSLHMRTDDYHRRFAKRVVDAATD